MRQLCDVRGFRGATKPAAAFLAASYVHKTTAGVGNVTLAMPSGGVEGKMLLLLQARWNNTGSNAGVQAAAPGIGETIHVESAGPTADVFQVMTRIASLPISAGMVSSGLTVEVGNYGMAAGVIFDVDDIAFHAVHATPGDATNFIKSADASGTSFTTQNRTDGRARDLGLSITTIKTYGEFNGAVGGGWNIRVDGFIPASIGTTIGGNFLIADKVLAAAGEATGATAFTTTSPVTSFAGSTIFVRRT